MLYKHHGRNITVMPALLKKVRSITKPCGRKFYPRDQDGKSSHARLQSLGTTLWALVLRCMRVRSHSRSATKC